MLSTTPITQSSTELLAVFDSCIEVFRTAPCSPTVNSTTMSSCDGKSLRWLKTQLRTSCRWLSMAARIWSEVRGGPLAAADSWARRGIDHTNASASTVRIPASALLLVRAGLAFISQPLLGLPSSGALGSRRPSLPRNSHLRSNASPMTTAIFSHSINFQLRVKNVTQGGMLPHGEVVWGGVDAVFTDLNTARFSPQTPRLSPKGP